MYFPFPLHFTKCPGPLVVGPGMHVPAPPDSSSAEALAKIPRPYLGHRWPHSRTHLELLPLMMMQEQDISHPFLGGPEGRCTMGSPIWPKPQVASVCHQPDRSVLGHKSHVACPWTVPLLWLPPQLDQGSFPKWEE